MSRPYAHPSSAVTLGSVTTAVTRAVTLTVVLGTAVLSGCGPANPYLDMGGDQLWEAGSAAYEDGEWADAIQALQRLTLQAPGHSQVPLARMYLARAHEERGEWLSAASEYDRFLQLYYNNEMAPQASLGACEAHAQLAPIPERDQGPTEQALNSCLRTVAEFDGLPEADVARGHVRDLIDRLAESWYRRAQSYLRLDCRPCAVDYFEQLIDQYPESTWTPRALLGIYRAYRDLEWEEEASETIDRLLFNFPDSPSAAQLRQELEASGRDVPG